MKPTPKPSPVKTRNPASHIKTMGGLRTRVFTPKTNKVGRKAKHKKG